MKLRQFMTQAEIEKTRTELLELFGQQVSEFEAQHGEVEPAPRGARFPRRPSRVQSISFMKRALQVHKGEDR
jgi:hypothetical protein